MKMGQKEYKDESRGTIIPAEEITSIATYKYGGDSFFSWTCLKCAYENQSRTYSVNGSFETCKGCGVFTFLLRSDVDYMNEAAEKHTMYIRRMRNEKDRRKSLMEKEACTFDETLEKFRKEKDNFEILNCIHDFTILKIARYFYGKGSDFQEKKYLVDKEQIEKNEQ